MRLWLLEVIDVSCRLAQSALSLQVGGGRSDSIALGIENRDVITVVGLVVKHKFVSVIMMRAGCHLDANERTRRPADAISMDF